uniref:Uncharacterized protein n=1 Tax=Angiostrongylus cantonensis TaxID=6313 RepID=A0A0K0D906_ANGCA
MEDDTCTFFNSNVPYSTNYSGFGNQRTFDRYDYHLTAPFNTVNSIKTTIDFFAFINQLIHH